MTWRPTEFEDLHRVAMSGDPDNDIRSAFADTEECRDMLRRNVTTWDRDGEILFVGGVDEMWKGVGCVWTLISDTAKEIGFSLTRGVVRELNRRHNEGYWRLQATVEHGNEAARLWIVRLGFVYEGTMYAYGPNKETYDLYSRVRL